MSEEYQEQQIHKLRELGKKYAKAKGELSFLDHNRQILLAKLMKEHMVSSNTGKLDSVASQNRLFSVFISLSSFIIPISCAVGFGIRPAIALKRASSKVSL